MPFYALINMSLTIIRGPKGRKTVFIKNSYLALIFCKPKKVSMLCMSTCMETAASFLFITCYCNTLELSGLPVKKDEKKFCK